MNYSSSHYSFKKLSLQQIQEVLNQNLRESFRQVEVSFSACPDLRDTPYNLAFEGIGGGTTGIVDLGGPPYLIPLVDRSKVYDLAKIVPHYVTKDGYDNGWFVSGAAAGPWPSQGSNCEMMINMLIDRNGQVASNKSRVALTSSGSDKDVRMKHLRPHESECALLANVGVFGGPGQVLHVKCTGRKEPDTNFTASIRKALVQGFGQEPVGLAGLFLINRSSSKIHIMRDFSTTPLVSDADVNNWLKFFDMEPPMLFQSVLVSSDPGLDLRIDHSHGWSLDRDEGGHYHHDTMPDTVEYHGIFAVAQKLWRIDPPEATHTLGRD